MRIFDNKLLIKKVYSPYKIAALLAAVDRQGITADAVLKGLGVREQDLLLPELLVSIQQYVDACQNAIDAGASPSTAFETGALLHLSAYGVYGYALLSSSTIRDYFDFGVKYHPLATPMLDMTWRETDHAAIFEFSEIHSFVHNPRLRVFLMQQQLSQNVTHIRDVTGEDVRPEKILLTCSDGGLGELYKKYLGCECHFDQRVNELHFSRSILHQTPAMGHQLSVDFLEDNCNCLLGNILDYRCSAREVYQLLLVSPNSFPNMEAVADRMCISSRTLRRRLANESVSFRSIFDEVRRALANDYLLVIGLSISDVSERLGFSDVAHFRRAFKRWEGLSPKEFLNRHLKNKS